MQVETTLDLEYRLPPQNVEVEAAILGGILLDENALERVSGFLHPKHFYVNGHRIIYQTCLALSLDACPVDMTTVTTRLSDDKTLDLCGGKMQLVRLIDAVVTSANIEDYAQLVIDKWKRRSLIKAASNMTRMAYQSASQWASVIESAEQEIFALTDSSEQKGLVHISELTCREYERIERVSGSGKAPGIESGFYDLDAMTQGYQPHQLIIVAGRPGLGKTAFLAAQLKHISKTMPCALFSLEMSGGQIAQRLLSEDCRIESGRMTSGKINSTNEWNALSQSVAHLSGLGLWVDESMQVTPAHILSQCRRLKAENGDLGMVAVDYLHLMLGDESDDTKALGRLTRQFKKMARELNCPIVLCSQLSRGVESRQDKRPIMSDLRQSGAIEQDADIIMFLYRDDYYNPESPDRGIAEVLIRKHRGGPVGTVKLLFEPEFTSFRNIAKGF